MKEANLTAMKAILAKQGERKTWGVQEHAIMLAKRTLAIIKDEIGEPWEEAAEADLLARLATAYAEDGLGTNASQFRQAGAKELAKSEETKGWLAGTAAESLAGALSKYA